MLQSAGVLFTLLTALLMLAFISGQALPDQEMTYYRGSIGNYDIYLVDIHRAISANLTHNPGDDIFPAWSPDGERLVFYSYRADRMDIYIMNADGRAVRRLAESGGPGANPAWSPDGGWIAFASNREQTAGIDLIRPDGSEQRHLTSSRASLIAWSPDSQWIAFISNCDNNCDIGVVNLKSGQVRRLTRNGSFDVFPVWSPDSQRIAFMSNRHNNLEIYVLELICDESALTGCAVARLTDNRGFDGFPAWSPDGRWIVFSSDRDGNFELYRINADCYLEADGCPAGTRLTSRAANDISPLWSPDGDALAFVSDFDVVIMTADGTQMRTVAQGIKRDQFLTWRPNGK